jgi:hypothetical protein
MYKQTSFCLPSGFQHQYNPMNITTPANMYYPWIIIAMLASVVPAENTSCYCALNSWALPYFLVTCLDHITFHNPSEDGFVYSIVTEYPIYANQLKSFLRAANFKIDSIDYPCEEWKSFDEVQGHGSILYKDLNSGAHSVHVIRQAPASQDLKLKSYRDPPKDTAQAIRRILLDHVPVLDMLVNASWIVVPTFLIIAVYVLVSCGFRRSWKSPRPVYDDAIELSSMSAVDLSIPEQARTKDYS